MDILIILLGFLMLFIGVYAYNKEKKLDKKKFWEHVFSIEMSTTKYFAPIMGIILIVWGLVNLVVGFYNS